jgi:hypothetical protein
VQRGGPWTASPAPSPPSPTKPRTNPPPPPAPADTRSVDQFVVAKKLGGGYASTVHLALDKATGIQVALKVYHRVKLSQLNQYQVKREIRIHSCLDHPNVLRLVRPRGRASEGMAGVGVQVLGVRGQGACEVPLAGKLPCLRCAPPSRRVRPHSPPPPAPRHPSTPRLRTRRACTW